MQIGNMPLFPKNLKQVSIYSKFYETSSTVVNFEMFKLHKSLFSSRQLPVSTLYEYTIKRYLHPFCVVAFAPLE